MIEPETRFGTLRFMAQAIQLLGMLIALATGYLASLPYMSNAPIESAWVFFWTLGVCSIGFSSSAIVFAVGAVIEVIIEIEHNTRSTSERVSFH